MSRFHKRITRTPRDAAAVIDFTRGGKVLPPFVTFARADATTCATRRRMSESVGLSRTNYIRNNAMVGAVAGTPGTLPSSWNVTPPTGLSQQVVGTGQEYDLDYIDIRIFGTATSAAGWIFIDSSQAAIPGQVWTASLGVRLAAGTLTNVSGLFLNFDHYNSTPAYLSSTSTSLSPGATFAMREATGIVVAGAATVTMLVAMNVSTGVAVDFTLRLYSPQFERGVVKRTPTIRTTGSQITTTAWPRSNYAAQGLLARRGQCQALANVSSQTDVLTVLPDGTYGVVNQVAFGAGGGSVRWGGTTQGRPGSPYVGAVYVRLISGTPNGPNCDLNDTNVTGFTLTGAWQRVTTSGSSANTFRFFDLNINATGSIVVQICMASLEDGTKPTEFFDVDVITPPFGDLEAVAANAPRFDYRPDTNTPRGLRIEQQADQLYTNTDWAAGWSFAGSSVFATGISWSAGGSPAVLCTSVVGQLNYISQGKTLVNGSIVHRSIRVKPLSTVKNVYFEATYSSPGFNLATMTVSGPYLGTAWIDTLEDGEYRLNHLFTVPATGTNQVMAFYVDTFGAAATVSSYLLSEPSLLQLTAPVPVDYIKNVTGAAVTRKGDDVRITTAQNLAAVGFSAAGSGWSGLIEFENGAISTGYFPTPFTIRDASGLNFVQFYISPTTGNFVVKVFNNNAASYEALPNVFAMAANTVYRVAFAITANRVALSINGGAVQTINVTIPISTFTDIYLGNFALNSAGNALGGWLRKFKGWARALTGGELIAEAT